MIFALIYHNAVKELLCFTTLSESFKSRHPWRKETVANSYKDTAQDAEAQPEDK